MANLIPKSSRYLDLLTTVEDVVNVFPIDQSRHLWDFIDIPDGDWQCEIEWITVVADKVRFDANDKPNFEGSLVTGYFEGGSENFGYNQNIKLPADMYTGPILPASETNIPITVVNIQWTKDNGETFNKQLLLVQNWTPGVDIGDPTLDDNYIVIEVPGTDIGFATVILEQFGPTIQFENFDLRATLLDVPEELSNTAQAKFYAILTGTTYTLIGQSTFTNSIANITIPTYRGEGDPLNFNVGSYTIRAEWPGRRNWPKRFSNTVIQEITEGIPLNVDLSLNPNSFTTSGTNINITAVATTQSGYPTIGANIANTLTFTLVGVDTFPQLTTATIGTTQFAGSSDIATATSIFTTTDLFFDTTLNEYSTYTINTASQFSENGFIANATVTRNYTIRADWDYYRTGLYSAGSTSTILASTTTRDFVFTIPKLNVYTGYPSVNGGTLFTSTVYNTGTATIAAIAEMDDSFANPNSRVEFRAYYTSSFITYPVSLSTGTLGIAPNITAIFPIEDAINQPSANFTLWLTRRWKYLTVRRKGPNTTETEVVEGPLPGPGKQDLEVAQYYVYNNPDYAVFRGQRIIALLHQDGFRDVYPVLPNGNFGPKYVLEDQFGRGGGDQYNPPAFVEYPGTTDYYNFSAIQTQPYSPDVSGSNVGYFTGLPRYQGDLIFYRPLNVTPDFNINTARLIGTVNISVAQNPILLESVRGSDGNISQYIYRVVFQINSISSGATQNDFIVFDYNFRIVSISGNLVTTEVIVPFSIIGDYYIRNTLANMTNNTANVYRNTPENLRLRTSVSGVSGATVFLTSSTNAVQINDYFNYNGFQYTVLSKTNPPFNTILVSPVPPRTLANKPIDIIANVYNPPAQTGFTTTVINVISNNTIQLNRMSENFNEFSYFLINNNVYIITSVNFNLARITFTPNYSGPALTGQTITILNSISAQDPVQINVNNLQTVFLGTGTTANFATTGSGLATWSVNTTLNSGTYFIWAEYIDAPNTNPNQLYLPVKNSDIFKTISEDGYTANILFTIESVGNNTLNLKLTHTSDPAVSQAYLFENPVVWRYQSTPLGTSYWNTTTNPLVQQTVLNIPISSVPFGLNLISGQWAGSMNQLTSNTAQKKYLPQTFTGFGQPTLFTNITYFNNIVQYEYFNIETGLDNITDVSVNAFNGPFNAKFRYNLTFNSINFNQTVWTSPVYLRKTNGDIIATSTITNKTATLEIWPEQQFAYNNVDIVEPYPVEIYYPGDNSNTAFTQQTKLYLSTSTDYSLYDPQVPGTVRPMNGFIQSKNKILRGPHLCVSYTGPSNDPLEFYQIEVNGTFRVFFPPDVYTLYNGIENTINVEYTFVGSINKYNDKTWFQPLQRNNMPHPQDWDVSLYETGLSYPADDYWINFGNNEIKGAIPEFEVISKVRNANYIDITFKWTKLHNNRSNCQGFRYIYTGLPALSWSGNNGDGYIEWNGNLPSIDPFYQATWNWRYRTVSSNLPNQIPVYGAWSNTLNPVVNMVESDNSGQGLKVGYTDPRSPKDSFYGNVP